MRQDITIDGMGCGHCVVSVKAALEKMDGLTVEHVGIGIARVEIESDKVSEEQIDAVVREAGYEPVAHEETRGV